MGPTFGIKGAAAGGGYSQAVPFETLALSLTGDMHAVTAAHNMLAAILDNHIYQGNELGIDVHDITWRRVLDVDDRALRNVITGLGTRVDGVPRQTGFDITAASEAMAVLALSSSLIDMRARLGRIIVGYTRAGEPITAEQLRGAGAMAVIIRDALKPNLLQTLENTPVMVHAGPFGNIAHGASSIVADLIGIRCGDYLVTEAGFGADMGAERFFNIKCRTSGLEPDAGVVVATVRALKVQSGRHRVVAGRPLPESLTAENVDDVQAGAPNLAKQVENIRCHGVTPVVAINGQPGDFPSDTRRSARSHSPWEYGSRSASPTPRVARASSSSPRQWPRRPKSRAASSSSIRRRCRSGRRSRRSPSGSTAPKGSTTPPLPSASSRATRRTGWGTCRSASPRPSTRCQRIPPCMARRPAGAFTSARCGPRSGRGFHLPDLRRHVDDARAQLDALGLRDRHQRRGRDRRLCLTTRRSSSAKAPAEPGPCSRRS